MTENCELYSDWDQHLEFGEVQDCNNYIECSYQKRKSIPTSIGNSVGLTRTLSYAGFDIFSEITEPSQNSSFKVKHKSPLQIKSDVDLENDRCGVELTSNTCPATNSVEYRLSYSKYPEPCSKEKSKTDELLSCSNSTNGVDSTVIVEKVARNGPLASLFQEESSSQDILTHVKLSPLIFQTKLKRKLMKDTDFMDEIGFGKRRSWNLLLLLDGSY